MGVLRLVLAVITGAAAGALAGGGLLLFTAWFYFPAHTHIFPKAGWLKLATMTGAGYGCVLGLVIGLASVVTPARRPTAALIGLVTGGALAVTLLSGGAVREKQPRVWMIMAPLLGALVGLCVSAASARN